MNNKIMEEIAAISKLNREQRKAELKQSDVAAPYKRYSSIRKLKKAIGFKKIGNWDIWDGIYARKEYNRTANRNHYKLSEIMKEEYYSTL